MRNARKRLQKNFIPKANHPKLNQCSHDVEANGREVEVKRLEGMILEKASLTHREGNVYVVTGGSRADCASVYYPNVL